MCTKKEKLRGWHGREEKHTHFAREISTRKYLSEVLHTNVCSTDKKRESDVYVQLQGYELTRIREM